MHTPTPWKYRVMGSEGCRIFPDTGNLREDMKYIGMIGGRDLQTDAENAAYIVRACNVHEELVQLTREMLFYAKQHIAETNWIERAEKALALAEVKP